MITIILAGGLGTRLAEYTDKIPKPMVNIGEKPILSHIMNFYKSYGHDEFIIAAGYKKEIIEGTNQIAGDWGHQPLPYPTHEEIKTKINCHQIIMIYRYDSSLVDSIISYFYCLAPEERLSKRRFSRPSQ